MEKKAESCLKNDAGGENCHLITGQEIIQTEQCARKKFWRKLRSKIKENLLLLLTLCGVLVGFGLGFGLRRYELSDSGLMWLGLPGEIFMRMLTLTILPLIVASIISGTASLDPKSNGKISMVAILYVVSSNAVGVLVGLIMFFIIKPDKYVDANEHKRDAKEKTVKLETQDIFADLIRNLFPNNIVTACFEKTQTSYDTTEKIQLQNGTNVTLEEYTRVIGTASGTNVLGLIIICSIIGIATGKLGEAGTPFVLFFKASSDIIIMVLRWFIWFTPVGVASLIAASVAKADNLESTFVSLAMFVLMLTLVVVFIILILVPGLYFIITRKNPFVFLYTAIRPMMSGFAPPSSAIAIPDVLVSAETKNGVDIRISRFSVPFGAALCRCGSGAFMVTVSLFLASMEGVSLQSGQIVYVTILAIVSTLAIPAVPSSSVICVIIILSSVNIHSTNIGIIMSLEWLQDRLRTTSNVMSNLFGAILINKVCRNSLTDTEKPEGDVTLELNSINEINDARL